MEDKVKGARIKLKTRKKKFRGKKRVRKIKRSRVKLKSRINKG